ARRAGDARRPSDEGRRAGELGRRAPACRLSGEGGSALRCRPLRSVVAAARVEDVATERRDADVRRDAEVAEAVAAREAEQVLVAPERALRVSGRIEDQGNENSGVIVCCARSCARWPENASARPFVPTVTYRAARRARHSGPGRRITEWK